MGGIEGRGTSRGPLGVDDAGADAATGHDAPEAIRVVIAAITAGIDYSIHGGIDWIVQRLSRQFGALKVFVAGGDADLLINLDCQPELAGSFLTLEGIRIASGVA